MASIYKRGGIYYVAIDLDGKRIYKSAKTTRKAEARRFLSEIQKNPVRRNVVRLEAFLKDFRAFSERTHARQTFLVNRRVGKLFLKHIGNVNLETIKPLDVERFKNSRLGAIRRNSKTETVRPTSVNIELRTIKAMFGYAVKWGLLEKSPFKGVTFVRIPQQPPAYLTAEQVKKLLEKVNREDLRAIIVFAVNTGMRRGEIMNLRWEHCDFANRVITVTSFEEFRTKTGRVNHVPMNEVVYHLLNQRPRSSEFVFVDNRGRRIAENFVTHEFKEYVRAAGLPETIHFHSLRHSFCSLLAKAGVPIFDIQKLVNHSQVSTTMVYSHLSPEHLRQSVEKLVTSMN